MNSRQHTLTEGLRFALERRKGQKDNLQGLIAGSKKKLRRMKRDQEHIQEAQQIIQTVAQATQQELQYHISDLVSLALATVFDESYRLEVEFVIKRGRTEAELWFVRGEDRVHPLSSSGGGAVDVAAFALRVALWALSRPRTRATLVLDEPFRFLSSDLQQRAGLMLREITQKLDLQIIMVSHVPDLIEAADKVFETRLKNGVTEIQIL